MASNCEDYCEMWTEKTKILEEKSLTSVRFSLVFHVSFLYVPQDGFENEEFEINNLRESAIDTQEFSVSRDRLINNDTSQKTLEEIFSSMHVPFRPLFVEKILSYARAMTNDKMYEGLKVLRMHVRISVVVVVDDGVSVESDDDGVSVESDMVGASKEAIERLEMVKIDDKHQLKGPCAICLQEFLSGLQVTCLPNCCHIFHDDCIMKWLKRIILSRQNVEKISTKS